MQITQPGWCVENQVAARRDTEAEQKLTYIPNLISHLLQQTRIWNTDNTFNWEYRLTWKAHSPENNSKRKPWCCVFFIQGLDLCMYSAESEALTEWKVSEVDKRVYDPPKRLWNVHSHAAYTTWEDTSAIVSLNCTHFTQNRKLLALSFPIASSDRPPLPWIPAPNVRFFPPYVLWKYTPDTPWTVFMLNKHFLKMCWSLIREITS